MHFLLDNLAATMIGVTIFLLVITVQQTNQASLADTTAFYAMIRQQEEFAKTVTRDMQGVAEVLTAEVQPNGAFSFRGHIGDDPALYTIVYLRESARTQAGVPFYRIRRFIDGEEVGGSGDIVTQWRIEGRDRFGAAVTDPDGAAQIFVRFEVGSLLGDKAEVEGTYWEASFFPPLLQ